MDFLQSRLKDGFCETATTVTGSKPQLALVKTSEEFPSFGIVHALWPQLGLVESGVVKQSTSESFSDFQKEFGCGSRRSYQPSVVRMSHSTTANVPHMTCGEAHVMLRQFAKQKDPWAADLMLADKKGCLLLSQMQHLGGCGFSKATHPQPA